MTENYGLTTTGTNTPDNLIAGAHPVIEIPITVASGEGVLVRGQVLGQLSANEKYAAYDAGAADGSESPIAVLGKDVDATSADAKAFAYVHGEFCKDNMTGLGADNAVITALQACGIYVKEVN